MEIDEVLEVLEEEEPVRVILMAFGCGWEGMLEVGEV
jgi:hypothetical protein